MAVIGLVISVALAWTMLVVAALARERVWTMHGLKAAFGNRDGAPHSSPFAARADRAARNMAENLLLFVAVLLAAYLARVPAGELALPSMLFVGGRLTYAPLYWAGVKYLRTLAWAVSVFGLIWIGVLAATSGIPSTHGGPRNRSASSAVRSGSSSIGTCPASAYVTSFAPAIPSRNRWAKESGIQMSRSPHSRSTGT